MLSYCCVVAHLHINTSHLSLLYVGLGGVLLVSLKGTFVASLGKVPLHYNKLLHSHSIGVFFCLFVCLCFFLKFYGLFHLFIYFPFFFVFLFNGFFDLSFFLFLIF